jgi:hypothetical protein
MGGAVQELEELGPRQVGAREEGVTRRGEQAGHRPAAVPGEGGRGRHVDGVDVGALLAVDLHGDEAPVDGSGDLLVLERLVGHDVAPVAGRVAHREQDRHVAALGLGEGVVAPLPPVDGVVGVLEEVGAE